MTTWTLEHLHALEEAIASGELEIYRDGMRTQYRSITELQRAYEMVRNQLERDGQLQQSAVALPSVTYAAFTRD
ncbi:phage head-tail joining protein [Chromobacterium piscinae]|uniref:phage head-tail joining protein n=1 Tax=Chromobacterium piscinae TaxID=686831 RepID=UPI003F7EC65F